MSNRQVTADYVVCTNRQVFKTYRSLADAQAYVRVLRSGQFLATHEEATLTIETRKANR